MLGILDDKDVPAIAAHILPFADRVVTLTPDSPRAIPAPRLKSILEAQVETNGAAAVTCADTAGAAFEAAVRESQEDDLIVVAGSFYTVALAYRWLDAFID